MFRKKTYFEVVRSVRGTWGTVNPVTKIIPNKKAYSRKVKHKPTLFEY